MQAQPGDRAFEYPLGHREPDPEMIAHGHVLVDRLPWRGLYDALFGGPGLVALLALSALAWVRRRGREAWRVGLALALPVGYVFAVTVLFEGGENMRYKFFVEPVLFVFVAAEAAAAAQRLRRAFGRAG